MAFYGPAHNNYTNNPLKRQGSVVMLKIHLVNYKNLNKSIDKILYLLQEYWLYQIWSWISIVAFLCLKEVLFFLTLKGGRAPPLHPYTGYTALCPFRDRERPVGQRSSVPKNWQTRRLDRENQNWNHRQKLSDAQKVGIKTSPHCSKTDGLKNKQKRPKLGIWVCRGLRIRSRLNLCWNWDPRY